MSVLRLKIVLIVMALAGSNKSSKCHLGKDEIFARSLGDNMQLSMSSGGTKPNGGKAVHGLLVAIIGLICRGGLSSLVRH